jgi:hypothetical protein
MPLFVAPQSPDHRTSLVASLLAHLAERQKWQEYLPQTWQGRAGGGLLLISRIKIQYKIYSFSTNDGGAEATKHSPDWPEVGSKMWHQACAMSLRLRPCTVRPETRRVYLLKWYISVPIWRGVYRGRNTRSVSRLLNPRPKPRSRNGDFWCWPISTIVESTISDVSGLFQPEIN